MKNLGAWHADMARDVRCALFAQAPHLKEVTQKYPVLSLVHALDDDHEAKFFGYRFLPKAFRNVTKSIDAEFGDDALSRYLLLVVAKLIELFEIRFSKTGLSEVFRVEFEQNFKRILAVPSDDASLCKIKLDNDLFMKDFGIARQILVPCASHLVFRYSGIPRRVFFSRALGERLQLLKTLVLDTHGFRPYLENHVHLSMLGEFDEPGRERCLRLVGELLRCWPDSRGLIGTSWYYDPAVGAVSPQLAYLHDVPAAGGACFLDMGETPAARDGALVRSPTRRRLAEAGEYQPRNFMMVWSRRKLLESYPAV